MKRIYKNASALLALLLVAVLAPTAALAQVSFRDDFGDYTPGSELAGNGAWWQYGAAVANPMAVVDGALDYEGYPGGVTGNCIQLSGETSNSQKVYAVFSDDTNGQTGAAAVYGIANGSVYYSILLNVESAPVAQSFNMPFIAAFVTRSTRDLAAKGSGSEKGKLYVKADGSTSYQLGVNCTSAATNIAYSQALEFNKTYLVVVKYTISNTLDGKDGMSLFVNPVDYQTEPASPAAQVAVGTGTGGIKKLSGSYGLPGIQALEIRHTGTSTLAGVQAKIGSLRISDTWAGLFEVKSTTDSPRVVAAPSNIDFGYLLQGCKAEKVVNIKGKNLKGNITVKVPEGSNLSVSTAEIPKEEAMSEAGFDLTVSINVQNPSLGKESIIFSSEEAEEAAINTTCNALPVSNLSTLKAFYGSDVNPGVIYRVATKPVISHVQQISVVDEVEGGTLLMNSYYFQDETGGVVLVDPYLLLSGNAYKVGDVFEGLTAEVRSGSEYGFDYNVLVPVTRVVSSRPVSFPHVESVTSGGVVTPMDVTLEQLNADPAGYLNRLVRVTGVNFENVETDAVYIKDVLMPLTDGKSKANAKIFIGSTNDDGNLSSDILGEAVPAGIINLTGISTSLSPTVIQPRSIADVETVETSALNITVDGENVALTVRGQEDGELPVVMSELTLNDNTQDLAVTVPFVAPGVKYVRNFANTEWQALYVPFAVDCAAWAADCDLAEIYNMHQYDDDENGTIDRTELEVIKKVSGQLLPNTPYLIRAKEAGEKTLQLGEVTVVPTAQASIDCSSTKVTYAFNGIYKAVSGSEMMDGGFYALSNGEIMQAASAEAGLHAFRWYMTATDRNGAPASVQSIRIRLRGEDGLNTGINDATVVAPGQLDNTYDLSGRRVEKVTKGLYIVNGKKVIVK